MGLDFVRHKAASFTKSWDRGRIALCERTLFTMDPEMGSRTALARTHGRLSADSPMLVRVEGNGLAGYHGLTRVASFVAPPPDLVEAVRETGGCAAGTVVVVHDGNVAEVALC
jgi:hypothetical protein